MFDAWRVEQGKRYNSEADEAHRLTIFQANVDYINAHNARGESSVVLATNQKDVLDSAVLDRVDNWFELPLPDKKERRRMLDVFFNESAALQAETTENAVAGRCCPLESGLRWQLAPGAEKEAP